jgi:predicted dehydrogenase
MSTATQKKVTRVAIIGLGPHGLRIADVLAGMPGVELTAVVDKRTEQLELPATRHALNRLQSADELFAHHDVDVVCIATNGPSHSELALAAMEAGVRRLMIEKPMACSLAECDAIIAKAHQTNSRVVVDHVRRYSPAYQWLQQRIASGDWGKLRAIWMQRPGIGLGCNAVHSFDTVVMLAGLPVERVTGWVDPPVGHNPRGAQFVDPGGLVIMELAGGVRAVVAQIEDGAGPTAIEIDLTAARVRIDERSGAIEIVERDLSVKPGPGRPAVVKYNQAPEGILANTAMPQMIRGCLDDLISDSPNADGRLGRLAIEVLVATYLSHESGNVPVALPLANTEAINRWLPVT